MDATPTNVMKFWFRHNAQHHANKLNQLSPKKDAKSLWTVALDECNIQYIVRKEYFGNVEGSYFELARHKI